MAFVVLLATLNKSGYKGHLNSCTGLPVYPPVEVYHDKPGREKCLQTDVVTFGLGEYFELS